MQRDLSARQAAAELFSRGAGYKRVATVLGLSEKTAEKWQYTCRALGKEALSVTARKKYSHELKVAAARDVVEAGMTRPDVMAKYGIASLTPLENWCRAYCEGGPDALLPKPKGRPRKPANPVYASREEELEARVRELEPRLDGPALLHSDQGWQYQQGSFQLKLAELGIVQSMSRKATCLDNACMEGLFGHMKDEFYRGRRFDSFESFKSGLDEYIEYWNTRCYQPRLKGMTPVQYRSHPIRAA